MRKSVLLALVLAVPASAQNSTTRCVALLNRIDCDTQTQPQIFNPAQPAVDAVERFNQGVREAQERRLRETMIASTEAGRIAEGNRGYIRQRVGQLVAGGDCKAGEDMAVANGEFNLATQVRTYCAGK